MAAERSRIDALKAAARERIVVLDGPKGTEIQRRGLTEADFRGELFAGHNQDLKGNNDILNLTRPDVIGAIHREYAEAGAEIISTNSFNANAISQGEYGLADQSYAINKAAASIARKVADEFSVGDQLRWVAGAIGPTNATLSISPDVNRPEFRATDFDSMVAVYTETARGLVDGGADYLLIETVFDTLNAKAAIAAVRDLEAETGTSIPMSLSMTVVDRSGRNLSGQTVEAFYASIRHADPLSVGLNCSLGAEQMRTYAAALARVSDTLVHAYPNAGLPNDLGQYDEPPETTSALLREWAENGLLNIVGGCCGTTPAHTRLIVQAVKDVPPRAIPVSNPAMRLSGLEPFALAG
ncbi:homocysteine S-methyltransferase family protein [Hyphobacterium sp. HN65]|uniref:Homocysteine S-methyltransferase family protein n=1 Tax=Hyphobacterium lacteum TaxID=3116575 RepID=A0ABU7LRY6_9PROT|nr:homocysteine S-methyltransferase family protein [Hyphobacterium sp. HN65]MEE2526344.1 homocysteine S-methyltransferase family protein [Hyphobacterium sp. HN65]